MLYDVAPTGAFELVVSSGIIITIGVFFFKSDGHIPFAYSIWHFFVNLALFIHYIALHNLLALRNKCPK